MRARSYGKFYIKKTLYGYSVFEGVPEDYPYVDVVGWTLTRSGALRLVERAKKVRHTPPEVV